ncbi:hypothetical protein ACFOLF_20790 [Paenibacillus sepulcri]
MYLSTKFILTRIFISAYKDKATLANGVVSLDRTSLLFHITLVEQAKYKSLSLQVRDEKIIIDGSLFMTVYEQVVYCWPFWRYNEPNRLRVIFNRYVGKQLMRQTACALKHIGVHKTAKMPHAARQEFPIRIHLALHSGSAVAPLPLCGVSFFNTRSSLVNSRLRASWSDLSMLIFNVVPSLNLIFFVRVQEQPH